MKNRLFVDRSICTGCRYCEAVCSLVHSRDKKVDPKRSRIRVHQDCLHGVFTPVVCRQCNKAPCMEACLFEAIAPDAQLGIPVVNAKKCTACMACVEACPFGAMSFDREEETAVKCDLCGGDPKCARFCRSLPHVGVPALSYVSADEWTKRKRGERALRRAG